jgi:transcriptional regulator with XRE-family HTH domain
MNKNTMLLHSNSLTDFARECLRESDDSARAYLIQGWLATTIGTLRDARRRAQLTQGEVARRLGTTQSAVARLEKDHEGRYSFQRYIEYLAVCDALPLAIETVPLAALQRYALADPDAPRTATAFQAWCETTAPIGMLEVGHRQGTIDAQLETPEEGGQYQMTPEARRRPSLSVLQGGLAEPFGNVADMEVLAV